MKKITSLDVYNATAEYDEHFEFYKFFAAL